jgi:hypothetical protein
MLNFDISPDSQFLILREHTEEVEKKQLELSLTKKIHNHFFHPLVKKKKNMGREYMFRRKERAFLESSNRSLERGDADRRRL